MDSPITEKSFELLRGLRDNTNKSWWEAHKDEFKTYVREPFAELLERCTDALADGPLPLQGSADTMFRQYRDVRFSKDKTPYKTSVSGLLTPDGTKNEGDGLIYLHMEATDTGGGFIASGFHKLSPKQLKPIRERMVEEPKLWSDALDSLNSHGLNLSMEDTLKTMPRGFSDHDRHEHADFIKLKSLIVDEEITQGEWKDGTVIARVRNMAKAVGPLLDFGR